MIKKLALLFLSLMLLTSMPTRMNAAPIELTASAKSAFNQTLAAAGYTMQAELNGQYNSFLALQEQDESWDERIKVMHYNNEETLNALRKQIKQINTDKINQLEIKLKQTKSLYNPLFTLNNSLNTLFGSSSDSSKIAVQLARLDIKVKKDALDALKESTAKKVKSIRDTIAETDSITVQIKVVRSAINSPKNRIPAGWDGFKQALKNNKAKIALDSLTALISNMNKIIAYKQKIYSLELTIKDIQLRAKAQIPL